MFRSVSVIGGMLACLAAACFGAQAQDGADAQTAPLDLRPMMARPSPAPLSAPKPKPKPAKQAVKSVIGGPLDPNASAAPKPARASKAPAKPAAKSAAHAAKPVATRPTQPIEAAPGLPTGSIKAAAPVVEDVKKVIAPEPSKPVAEARPPFDEYVVAQYCNSLSSAASDGRLAWQAKRLDEMEGRLRDRIAELEAKRAETADWLKRREEAMKKADESVVAIYSKMKPDAAAAQFSAMDESGAAAILSKLKPAFAGTILNEIDASRAARIAAEMAGVGPKREIARSVP